jgi:aspartokinase/homoserine dehydrogenase 1
MSIDARHCDARDFIVTDETFGGAIVDFGLTKENVKRLCTEPVRLRISPGFIARSNAGRATTLGRDGSDYTASIIGALTNASVVELWTDVNGVMTANPGVVENAISIDAMTYEEAMELSHFGARVIHPPTMHPVMKSKIPLVVRNTYNPDFDGTVISDKPSASDRTITGITTISPISLMTISGGGMIGVKGLAGRLFTTLGQNEINLILITQASSEHSICFAIAAGQGARAKDAIEKEFAAEIANHVLNPPSFEKDLCILAIVGEKMRQKPGIAGGLFSALGENNINVAAIAQGSSERNISIVIHNTDQHKAKNKIHSEFF